MRVLSLVFFFLLWVVAPATAQDRYQQSVKIGSKGWVTAPALIFFADLHTGCQIFVKKSSDACTKMVEDLRLLSDIIVGEMRLQAQAEERGDVRRMNLIRAVIAKNVVNLKLLAKKIIGEYPEALHLLTMKWWERRIC
jgi:hypothetical protein